MAVWLLIAIYISKKVVIEKLNGRKNYQSIKTSVEMALTSLSGLISKQISSH